MTVSVDLLVGSTVFKSQHNRLELPYIKRMIVVILYRKKKIVWQEDRLEMPGGCWAYSYFTWRPREVWFEVQIVAHQCRVNEIDVRSGDY